ncbi:MAG: FAD-binding domain-containing protein [Verrucomicrobiota bacterium]
MFLPTKWAALNALGQFLPRAGFDYAANRNFDNGPSSESSVSKLSPWVRVRMLPEWDIVSAVLEEHCPNEAAKFIDEVCWRTYWKGWLELRPSVWTDYLQDQSALLQSHQKHIGYHEAIEGRTGIDSFDAWNQELVEINYLHNHARMWYASIWVHTLKLPWQLGADWFLRHLLDGDAASNTLSWRWVAGLHTRGKTYCAQPDNIRKYTKGRFTVDAPLASEPVDLGEPDVPKPSSLAQSNSPTSKGLRLGLLVTDDDLSVVDWLPSSYPVVTAASFSNESAYRSHGISEAVIHFRRDALSSLELSQLLVSSNEVVKWAQENELDGIITASPIVGFNQPALRDITKQLGAVGTECFTKRHWWDELFFPHATHGFFRFKKAIPKMLSRLNQEAVENPPHGAGSFHDPDQHHELMKRVEDYLRNTT